MKRVGLMERTPSPTCQKYASTSDGSYSDPIDGCDAAKVIHGDVERCLNRPKEYLTKSIKKEEDHEPEQSKWMVADRVRARRLRQERLGGACSEIVFG